MYNEFKANADVQEAIIRSLYEYIGNNADHKFANSDADAKILAEKYLKYAYKMLNGEDIATTP